MEDETDRCFNYRMSRAQRETELSRGQGVFGTSRYERAGCYECDGYKECHGYLVIGTFGKLNNTSGSR